MKQQNLGKSNQNGKEGAKFPSKNIKHDRQAESARTKFGLRSSTDDQTK